MPARPFKPGDRVLLAEIPPWVAGLPEESAGVYRFCLGRSYLVSEIDEHGHLVLDVSADIDARYGGSFNDIRVEPAYVRLALERGE